MTKRDSNTSAFFAKYQHPKWQKRRLEVMANSDFSCSDCGNKDQTLNVHHVSYIKGRDPWDYGDDELRCLCSACHAQRHTDDDRFKAALHKHKSTYGGVDELLGYLDAIQESWRPQASSHRGNYFLGYSKVYGWEYTEAISMQMSEVYDYMNCLDFPAFNFVAVNAITKDEAVTWSKCYNKRGDHYFDDFPPWLREKAHRLVAEALTGNSDKFASYP